MKKFPFGWFIKGVISTLLLVWLLRRVSVREIFHILSTADIGLYALAVVLSLAVHGVGSYKWQRLLMALNLRESCLRLWVLNLISLFYSLILPGQLFGEAIKAYRLAHGKQEKAKLVMSVVVDRLTSLIALLCLGLIGIVRMPTLLTQRPLWIISFVLLLVCLLLIVLMFNVRWQALLMGWAARIMTRSSLNIPKRRLNSVWTAFIGYRHCPQTICVALLLSFVFQSLSIVLSYCIAHAMGLRVPLLHLCWIMAIVSLVQMLPVTLAGLGAREGVLVYLLKFEGVQASQALAYSLALFVAIVILGLTGGVLDLLCYLYPASHGSSVVSHHHLKNGR